MNRGTLLRNPLLRNALGFLLLAAVHFASDFHSLQQRPGFQKTSPYIFLLLMYGWIVFHNRILFEGLYLKGKKKSYILWTLLGMSISTFNMYFIITQVYHIPNPLPHILSFWVYTITGFGVYVIFRYLHIIEVKPSSLRVSGGVGEASHFVCTVDGNKKTIPCGDILFIESLENYVKVNTTEKKYLVRLTLKEAEERLPGSFIRISRSHIVNTAHIIRQEADVLTLKDFTFRIGKVYKRYVEEQLKGGV